jgi:hypothetical protein
VDFDEWSMRVYVDGKEQINIGAGGLLDIVKQVTGGGGAGTLAHALAAGTESLFPYISLDFKQEEVHIGGVTEHPELDGIGDASSRTGLTTAAIIEAGGVGVEVERGPDWYEDDQDGGIGNTGVVLGFLDENGEEHGEYGHIGFLKRDCANVKWSGQDAAYHYSMGCDKNHEFELSLSKAYRYDKMKVRTEACYLPTPHHYAIHSFTIWYS